MNPEDTKMSEKDNEEYDKQKNLITDQEEKTLMKNWMCIKNR